MKKYITWIDDDISQMKRLAFGLFPELWEKGYKNQIFFSGNDYLFNRETVPIQQKDIERFGVDLNDIFNFFCGNHVDGNYKTPMEVREAKKILCYVPLVNIEFPIKSAGKTTPDDDNKEIINKIIETIDDKVEEDSYIGLDICLFNDSPKVTMQLFYNLFNKKLSDDRNRKYAIFLYSNYFDSINAWEKWKKDFLKEYNNFDEKAIVKFSREYLISPERDKGEEARKFWEFLAESMASGR